MKTAIIATVSVLTAGIASASLTTTFYDVSDLLSAQPSVTQSVTVAAGDMIVFATAGNKKTDTATQTYSTTAGGAFTIHSAASDVGNDATMNAMIGYYTATTAGTYDFIASTTLGTQTAAVGLYHLVADSGQISAVSVLNGNRQNNMAAGTTQDLNFINMGNDPNYANFDGILGIGVTAMNGSGGTVAISNNIADNFTIDEIDADQRAIVSSDLTGKATSRWVFDYTTPNTVDDAGNLHMAFAEVIPEPATMGLIGAFGGAILFIRRRFMIG